MSNGPSPARRCASLSIAVLLHKGSFSFLARLDIFYRGDHMILGTTRLLSERQIHVAPDNVAIFGEYNAFSIGDI